MARARIDDGAGRAAVRAALDALADGTSASRSSRAQAVRYTLQLLAEQAEGNTLEVRVPPFGAVQCVAGPRHTRGTPPNVIETDAATWLALATGSLAWPEGLASGAIHASGARADLTGHVPVLTLPAG
ncbi:sterol carrier family protein [Cryobacterium sp. PH29-G1]|uniref:sterol carrier family protein n=1 Tax=Cryobacterium sp. PH29-G1 TaxID=3046211 RepID=UPI0024B89B18|nr:sterol carrier family protein [Cryobacterium sp. PH29-G1]MDJ0350343.1 sterol carrier family protein [Cryobacterium sp. PH29-G1]